MRTGHHDLSNLMIKTLTYTHWNEYYIWSCLIQMEHYPYRGSLRRWPIVNELGYNVFNSWQWCGWASLLGGPPLTALVPGNSISVQMCQPGLYQYLWFLQNKKMNYVIGLTIEAIYRSKSSFIFTFLPTWKLQLIMLIAYDDKILIYWSYSHFLSTKLPT